jgi:hypothetical protein
MAMGRRRKTRQRELFVAASEIRALGNPFYRPLNRLLDRNGFDERRAVSSTRRSGVGRAFRRGCTSGC